MNFEEIVIDKSTTTTTPRRNRRQGMIHLAPCINRITDSYADGFRKEARSDHQEASVKNSPSPPSISNLDIKLTYNRRESLPQAPIRLVNLLVSYSARAMLIIWKVQMCGRKLEKA
jgi:hypothetical protein